MLEQAIRVYQELLTDDLAAETQGALDQQQQSRKLTFGEKPLCTVLRPRFLTPWQLRFLQERCRILLGAFAKAQRAALADQTVLDQFALKPWEVELVREDPGFACAYPTSRLDAFFVSESDLHFTEFNAETPAGAAYNDALTEMFLALPIIQSFRRRYQVRPLPARPGVLEVLLSAYHEWAGRREKPRIAILDWPEVPTYTEFLLYQDYFRSQGFECIIADPREAEYANGRLQVGDFHITLIYKRVLISELYERCGLKHPVVRAIRERAVCMVNPFPCKILYKKASFAVLTDERNAYLFTDVEQKAIADHIPWTRRLEERHTLHGKERVDLVPHIMAGRDRFVLKPNDDYGGAGIVLGWTVDGSTWEKAVQHALANNFVVQERVKLPSESYPSWIDGKVQWIDRILDTNPFCYHGEYVDSFLTRISTAALVNVTAGGGSTVPTLIVDERP